MPKDDDLDIDDMGGYDDNGLDNGISEDADDDDDFDDFDDFDDRHSSQYDDDDYEDPDLDYEDE